MKKYIKILFLGFTIMFSKLALAAKCFSGGQEIPCNEIGRGAGSIIGIGFLFILIFLAISIWATVFWILMLIHLAKHDVEHKVMWVLIMVFTGIIGSIVYYFVEKKKFDKPITPQTPKEEPKEETKQNEA